MSRENGLRTVRYWLGKRYTPPEKPPNMKTILERQAELELRVPYCGPCPNFSLEDKLLLCQ